MQHAKLRPGSLAKRSIGETVLGSDLVSRACASISECDNLIHRRLTDVAGPANWVRKPIGWCGSSLDDLRVAAESTRRQAGQRLRQLQDGEEPADWKPMPTVGPGTIELRFHGLTEYRVVLVTRFVDAIYVLHVFEKKSRKTPRREIELARVRYNRLVMERLG